MKILLACELYFPSIGGVQVVMRQLAERFAQRGHEVTVVTTKLKNRDFSTLNGVNIVEFDIMGNLANGMRGEIDAYQQFVKQFPCDVLLIKAAQQWTFDALWPALDDIHAKKVFIPCGFAALYELHYQHYYREIPNILKKFDHLIFYSDNYRDINFARQHQLTNYSVIPNGADENEFNHARDADFRKRHGIAEDSFIFLTVGSLTGTKGHLEVSSAFARLKSGKRPVTLILNGNNPFEHMPPVINNNVTSTTIEKLPKPALFKRLIRKIKKGMQIYHQYGLMAVIRRTLEIIPHKLYFLRMYADKTCLYYQKLRMPLSISLSACIKRIETQPEKQVLQLNLPREELIQAYMNADLFVFASNIEYSPLVLFETAAAGTPFLSVPVGNAQEIAAWTNAGFICEANINQQGYVYVKPKKFAKRMQELMKDKTMLRSKGKSAKHHWQEKFTWHTISLQYEQLFQTLITHKI